MPDNRRLKLSQDKIQSIADEYCKGTSSLELAKKYDVTIHTILKYVRRLGCDVRPGAPLCLQSSHTCRPNFWSNLAA